VIAPPVDIGARVEYEHLFEFRAALDILAERAEVVDLHAEKASGGRVGEGLAIECIEDEPGERRAQPA
jgi:hypothetical protein